MLAEPFVLGDHCRTLGKYVSVHWALVSPSLTAPLLQCVGALLRGSSAKSSPAFCRSGLPRCKEETAAAGEVS